MPGGRKKTIELSSDICLWMCVDVLAGEIKKAAKVVCGWKIILFKCFIT